MSFNRRLEMPELETSRTELCSGGVCAAACLDSWEVFGMFSMFLGADWRRGQWGVVGWVAGMLVFAGGWEGVCLAMPCQGAGVREQHLQDVSCKGFFYPRKVGTLVP